MNTEDKRLLRAVVKRVHPDLFTHLEKERDHNSQSLKVDTDCTLLSEYWYEVSAMPKMKV